MLKNTKPEFDFQELFDKAAIPLCVINKNDKKLLVNNQFQKTFGYSSEEIPSLNDWFILAYPNPDYRKFVSESCDKVIQKALNEHADFEQQEFNITCKNGDVLTMLISGSEVGSDYLITFFDITERNKSSEEKEMLSFAINRTSEAIFIYRKDIADIIYANSQACHSLGYSREELMQLSTYDIDPDITPERINQILKTVHSGQPLVFETKHKAKNGHIFPVEIVATEYVFNNQAYSISLVRDISKRKKQERILQESEEKYRTLAEKLPDNIARYDKNCRTVYCNQVLEKSLNTTFDDIKGLKPSEISPDGRFDEYENILLKQVSKACLN